MVVLVFGRLKSDTALTSSFSAEGYSVGDDNVEEAKMSTRKMKRLALQRP